MMQFRNTDPRSDRATGNGGWVVLAVAAAFSNAMLTSADDSLFRTLDHNNDGVVERGELTPSQLDAFERALRVADQNADGALQAAEFAAATSDDPPRNVTSQASRFGGAGANFDIRQWDRNSDGRITPDEVPQPLKERFQQALDRAGVTSVRLDQLRELLQGQLRPESPEPSTQPSSSDPPQIMSEQDSRRTQRVQAVRSLIERLDADGDRRISREEQQRLPAIARMLDSNQDGQVTEQEIRAALRAAENNGSLDSSSTNPDNGRNAPPQIRPGTPRRSGEATTPMPSPTAMFERLDRNNNGKLSADEIPERLRQSIRRADRNNDGEISADEWKNAADRLPR
ncbi:MAG: hypothetical protein KDA85_02845 [Planctomycetaceae bacterium]|nr:hypothetical protein [Planctomycetaceae bacterium]